MGDPIVVICAWCPNAGPLTALLASLAIEASHGICDRCLAQHFPEDESIAA